MEAAWKPASIGSTGALGQQVRKNPKDNVRQEGVLAELGDEKRITGVKQAVVVTTSDDVRSARDYAFRSKRAPSLPHRANKRENIATAHTPSESFSTSIGISNCADRFYHRGGHKLQQIISSSRTAGNHRLNAGALTRVMRAGALTRVMRAGVLTRVMRAVLSGDRQAILVTPTSEDIKAVQGLKRLATRVEPNHVLPFAHLAHPIAPTNARTPTTASEPRKTGAYSPALQYAKAWAQVAQTGVASKECSPSSQVQDAPKKGKQSRSRQQTRAPRRRARSSAALTNLTKSRWSHCHVNRTTVQPH